MYGYLTVIEEGLWTDGSPRRRAARCLCACGIEVVRIVAKLKSGSVKSCGCKRGHGAYHSTEPNPLKGRPTHGMTGSRTMSSWANMKQRCSNPKAINFSYYGGRGIRVCERWTASFSDFLADMGERPDDTTLDRYPNKDGDYEPGNCRWATQQEQADNRVLFYTRRKIYGIA